jgi:hypothetical protein
MTSRAAQFRDLAVAAMAAWLVASSGLLFRSFELLLLGPSVAVIAFAALLTYRRVGSVVWTAAFSATLPPLFLAILVTLWYLDPSGESPWGLMDGALFILFLAVTVFGALPAVIGLLGHLALQRMWRLTTRWSGP